MKFALVPINVGDFAPPDQIVRIAQKAEALGFESVWSFEHVIMPYEYASKYPYSRTGKAGAESDTKFVDPFIAFSYAAAATQTLRFGTGVNILGQANPLYFAKQAASVDYLSGGRLMLGVGVGWLAEEFHAMGVPFHDRGPRTTDTIKALRAAWNGGGEVTYKSAYIDWSGFELSPQLAQPGGIPITVGGVTAPAIRRAVALGDGWFPVHKDLDDLARLMDKLRAEGRAQGRDTSELEITSFYHQHKEPPEALERYAELGVNRVLVNLIAFGEGDVTAAMERFAEQVLRKYAA